MTLCVYALTGPQPLPRLGRGVGGERLQLLRWRDIAAVVGELPQAPRPVPARLREYAAIIQRLGDLRDAILPARFGTCFSDPAELDFILRARQQSLRRALRHVRRRAQMTVRVIGPRTRASGPGDSGLGPVDTSDANQRSTDSHRLRCRREEGRSLHAGSRSPDPGSRYLRARAAQQARAGEIPGFEPVRTAVRRWMRDESVDVRPDVASVYHLVPRSSADDYRRAAQKAAAAAGLHIVVTGPWPPYAFTGW